MILNPTHLLPGVHFDFSPESETLTLHTRVAFSALYSKLQEIWTMDEDLRKLPFTMFSSEHEWDLVGKQLIDFEK